MARVAQICGFDPQRRNPKKVPFARGQSGQFSARLRADCSRAGAAYFNATLYIAAIRELMQEAGGLSATDYQLNTGRLVNLFR